MDTTSPSTLSPPPSSSPPDTDIIKQAEAIISHYLPTSAKDKTRNILKALLDHAPSPSGRRNIAHDIIVHHDPGALADYYIRSLLFPLLDQGGKTPGPSHHSLGQDSIDEIASRPQSQAGLKKILFLRDNNRCVISGIYDLELWGKLPDDEKVAVGEAAFTEVAHILPFTLGEFTEDQLLSHATVWDCIFHVLPELKRTFNINDINDPSNAFTLQAPLHRLFSRFRFCLEPTGTPNTYHIHTFGDFPSIYLREFPANREIIFTAHDERYNLPNPDLLHLHSAVAKVLNESGVRYAIEEILGMQQEIGYFAEDGPTDTRILTSAF